MKRLLLAPLFLTLLLSSCKGQQIGEEKYVSELDLAVEQMELITNMVEDYKQRGIMLKNQNSPISAKAMIQRSIDLIYKAEDLKDYSVCLNEKRKEKIIFEIGRAECFVKTGVDLSTSKWLIE